MERVKEGELFVREELRGPTSFPFLFGRRSESAYKEGNQWLQRVTCFIGVRFMK